MTSKHSFFKYMREDLRHKIWMLALSALGNFLAIPVAYLIINQNYEYTPADALAMARRAESYIGYSTRFFGEELTIAGGIIACVGAVIVGLLGFRYLFNRKMVDTYHSMPIKRSKLFLVNYINGILIWLVPFLACTLITVIMAIVNMNRHAAEAFDVQTVAELFKQAGMSACALCVSFLLVYHLVLIAVMISGNILNTLVSACILGGGVISVYLLGCAFLEIYMDTFYSTGAGAEVVVYASPLVSAVYLLYVRNTMEGFGTILFFNVLIMLALGILARYLYIKRASELAEQGIKNKVATLVMKLVTSVVAGMGGWLVFVMMTQEDSWGWGMFGAVLVSLIAYGVLNMIFHMDFKAFAANKVMLIGSTVLTVFICLTFSMDWIGYDNYVPDAEDVKELAFYSTDYSNRAYYFGEEDWPLDSMHIQDKQAIVAFLTAGVNNVGKQDYGVDIYSSLSGNALYDVYRKDTMVVKVTLESGREYYRSYDYFSEDKEVVWPLITGSEYVESVYMIHAEAMEEMQTILVRNSSQTFVENLVDKELIEKLVIAYNRDLAEKPEEVIGGEGRLLGEIKISTNNYNHRISIDVYESMEHTIAVLQATGYGQLPVLEPEEVAAIHISLDYRLSREQLQELDMEKLIRDDFGLATETVSNRTDTELSLPASVEQTVVQGEQIYNVELKAAITDDALIRELLPLLHYDTPNRGRILFGRSMAGGLTLEDKEGKRLDVYIRSGDLPEKYLELFELEITEE